MFFELMKLIHKKWLVFISVLLIVLTGVLFTSQLNVTEKGNDFRKIKEYYNDPDAFLSVYEDITFVMNESDNESEAVDRMKEQRDYSVNMKALIRETALKKKMGIAKNEYDLLSMEKSVRNFCRIQNLNVPVSFHGGMEKFLNNWYSTAVAIVIGLISCFILFVQQWKEKIMFVISATEKGKKTLFRNQCLAVILFSLVTFLLTEMMLFIISLFLGVGNINDPVQSIYGMWLFPFHLTILEYLGIYLILKILLISGMISFLILICSFFHKEWKVIICIFAVILISVMTYNHSDLYINSLNLFRIMNIQKWFCSVIYLNILSVPVNRFYLIMFLTFLQFILVISTGYLLWNRIDYSVSKTKDRSNRMTFIFSVNEWKKYWLVHGGIVSLILTGVIQYFIINQYQFQMSQPEMFYQRYAEILRGEKNTEKDQFLVTEKEYLLSDTTGDMYQRRLGFEMAEKQYKQLSSDEKFTDRLSYYWFTGKQGKKVLYGCMILLMAGLCYTVSLNSGIEYETGVSILMKSSGNDKKVKKNKSVCMTIHLIALWIISFLPVYFKVNEVYGIQDVMVNAGKIPYAAFLMILIVIQITASAFFVFILNKLAEKIKVSNYVLMTGIAIIIIQVLIWLL